MTDTSDTIASIPNDARRSRGLLEADVKGITDRFVSGDLTLPEGVASLTPHFIGLALKQQDVLEKAPSTGAVTAILKRWEEVGFIVVSQKPYAFVDYTHAARVDGLAALKAASAAVKKEFRAAAKAASAAIPADDADDAAASIAV